MRRAFAVVALIGLSCAACATIEKAPGDTRLAEAQKAFDEGQRLRKEGHFAEALPPLEHALELRRAALGEEHPEVARCMNLLGDIYRLQGDYARAQPLIERALTVREAALGMNHPDVANSLHSLALFYAKQGDFARAEPLYERALTILEAALGKNHVDLALPLTSLASLYTDKGQYARAEPLLERALAIRKTALGENHPDVAISFRALATVYYFQGDYIRAEPLLQRALGIQEAVLDKNHPYIADSLNILASLYTDQGEYARAEPLYERALAIREVVFGKNHPLVADSLNNLASLYVAQGQEARAQPLFERSLAIEEEAFGKNHPDVASTLNNLANIYRTQGQNARAEPLLQRALAIWETALGKSHPDVASALNNLANLYTEQGDYARAEPLYERGLAIREMALGNTHPKVADSLINLANLYTREGQYTRAAQQHERALAIREAAFGKDHPSVANSLMSLGLVSYLQRDYPKAEKLYLRALAIQEVALGKNHLFIADSLNNLALVYLDQGNFARAKPLYERALAIREASLGNTHPQVAESLNNLAVLHLAQQELPKALSLFERAFALSEGHLRQEVFGFSEARLATVLLLLRADEERLYALARAHPGDARVRHLALTAAILRKGRSLEEISSTSRIIARSLEQTDRETFERLRAVRAQFSKLSLEGPDPRSPTGYQQRLKDLSDQGDALEATLARSSAPLRALSALPPPAELISRTSAALPSDGVLIEFITYRDSPPITPPGATPLQPPGELRYLALLLLADGSTRAVDLGPAAPIDQAVVRLHDALADRAAVYQPAAQALYTLALRPLVPLLGKARHLFLSPDGQLALVPFAALHDGRRFLIDAFDITYLSSGKDLLPRSEDIPPARSVVVMADPDFDALPATPSPAAEGSPDLTQRSASLERVFSSLRAELADQPWPALPGTRKEAQAIQRLFPQAQLFLGPAATKEALLKLPAPGILHIATHGFFGEDASTVPATRSVVSIGAVSDPGVSQRPPDPLLRSGLVLAGASPPSRQAGSRLRTDALVTALELASLDLWGTQLVVLSACDTGRGDVKLGQGVYGLRRALVAAGVESSVTSLWKVNDETTSQLMEAYYANLAAGQGRTSALREAMRAFRLKQPHPHFWAAFIAIGLDTPLRGLTPHDPEQH